LLLYINSVVWSHNEKHLEIKMWAGGQLMTKEDGITDMIDDLTLNKGRSFEFKH